MSDTFKQMSRDGGGNLARMAQMMGGGGAPGNARRRKCRAAAGYGKLKAMTWRQDAVDGRLQKLTGGSAAFRISGDCRPGFNPFKK